MLISAENKSINFNIIGYEFPDRKPTKKEFDYEANWLNLEVVYCDKNENKTYTDSCLLTYELSDLINAFQEIINGDEDSYVSNFLEPYLSICVSKIDEFIIFVFSFVCDTVDRKWSKRKITAKWTLAEAKEKLNELKNMELKFPKR